MSNRTNVTRNLLHARIIILLRATVKKTICQATYFRKILFILLDFPEQIYF